MASAADELMLLERVFLRVGSADTDEQLQNVLCKFLPPVLLKLSSQQEGVRKKVMELLIHVNKRLKNRPTVQLPVEALLVQYQDPTASSFLINFTIIYIKMGFPRLPVEKQVELVPTVLNSMQNKPQTHQDSLLLLIVPLLGSVKVPSDPLKRSALFELNEKPQVAKQLLSLLQDMLLLPYGALTPVANTDNTNSAGNGNTAIPVPPGMSEYSYKRVTSESPLRPEELEQVKLGIVKFLAQGVFPDEDILIHMIIAAADTRFSVANLADMEIKKVISTVDWSSSSVCLPMYLLFLGSQTQNLKPDMKKSPVSTRIRLKILTYLCRATGAGIIIPACIQVVFDSLYGANTNTKLKTLALQFAANIVRYTDDESLSKVSTVLQTGLKKLIREGEPTHQGQAFLIIGMLAQRFPIHVFQDVALLELFFKSLDSAATDLKLQIREGLLNLIVAYKYDVCPEEVDQNGRLNLLFGLLQYCMSSEEPMVRFAAVRSIATIFPADHVPSKFFLLLATGDSKDEVSMEAMKSLYGTTRKADVDMAKKNKVLLPPFSQIIKYIYSEAEIRSKDPAKRVQIGGHTLPFTVPIYTEILIYLRLCLIRGLEVPLTRDIIKHPSEFTPIIRGHLHSLFDANKPIEDNPLLQYISLIKALLFANPTLESLSCLLEIIGCIPSMHVYLKEKQTWFADLVASTKEEIREQASVLYAIIANEALNQKQFEELITRFFTQVNGKNLEAQHGAILAIANCMERKLMTKKDDIVEETHKRAVTTITPFLTNTNNLLIGAACTGIGLLAKSAALPLDAGKSSTKSPDAKRPANGKITKIELVGQLGDVLMNNKLPSKVREKAAKSMGLLCVGESFPHGKEVMQVLLDTANQTKDVEVHFTIGESLVMCVQGIWSPEARDAWTTLPNDHTPSDAMIDSPKYEHLEWLLDELFKLANMLQPNTRQAACIWLLAVLKSCPDQEVVKDNMKKIQDVFMNLLGENNDIVQDVASKGLCLVYDISKSEELLAALVDQLTTGRRQVSQVTSDTKLFEEGQLGSDPTGGNLTTYKELCSLASDLNKPDLIYQFMHLANHNSIWNSKKGAAYGFSSIAEKCSEHLQAHLSKIVPKLYRYQFDPTPSIQMSMQNIWHVLVPESQKVLDQYHNEILEDLVANLTAPQYRVRQSCCLALQDFLKGAGNRSIHDSVHKMNELWSQLFRVMDDHHEATRMAAIKTAKVLSKLCIRGCAVSQGKAGVKMLEAILPIFLQTGITNQVAEVRAISLQTVSELVGEAGNQLKPFLPQLIPALLQATGELESTKLSYLSTMLGAQAQAQEAVDSARASFAKSHFTTETVAKCLQYADASILESLVPQIADLMKSSVGLGTKVVCAHFINLLVVHLGKDLQPYTGKLLASLVNGLTDRNAAVRKHYAIAIGHLVSTAKETSLEKLFEKIRHWYFEREDDSIRSACAQTIQSIGQYNQEILKSHSEVVLPLVFFAMHAEKTPETENSLEIWNEIWAEHSPGTETGIKQNLDKICEVLKMALESPSWTMKAQAANAVSTVASKLGSTMDLKHRNNLIKILLDGLSGRTWNGKDKLLKALSSICSNCKKSLLEDKTVDLNLIVDAVLKESRKEEIQYKISALQALGTIVSSLEVDKFVEVHALLQSISDVKKDEDEDMSSEDVSKNRESHLKLKETVYETLGKAWPEHSKAIQEKYREEFVEHCAENLKKESRSVQVCLVTALGCFVDKLGLLKEDELTEVEEASLGKIVDGILEVLKYSLEVTKNLRLRKESLNILNTLGKRLKEKERNGEFQKLQNLFKESLPELEKDHQPEIRSRVTDLKTLFKD